MNTKAKKATINMILPVIVLDIIYCLILGEDESLRPFQLILLLLFMIIGIVIVGTSFARENITQGHIGVIYRSISVEEQMHQRRAAIRSEHFGSWLFGAIVFFTGFLLMLYHFLLGDFLEDHFIIVLPYWSHAILLIVLAILLLYYRYLLYQETGDEVDSGRSIIMRNKEALKVDKIEGDKGRTLEAVKRPGLLNYIAILLLAGVFFNLVSVPSKSTFNVFLGAFDVVASMAAITLLYQLWIISSQGWKYSLVFFSADLIIRSALTVILLSGFQGLTFAVFVAGQDLVMVGFLITLLVDAVILAFIYRQMDLFSRSTEIEFI